MKIGLLQCDRVVKDLQPSHGDVPGLFFNLFNRFASHVSLSVFDVTKGQYPDLNEQFGGFISTGARYSVYDQDPWILQFKEFVHELYHRQKKFVGICFGHQMIAESLGGKCKKSNRGWGVGIKEVRIQKKKSWMQPEKKSYQLIVSHADQVVRLPENSEVLGSNEHCPCSIFTVGNNFLGIQGHPEFTAAYAEDLMYHRLDRIGKEVIDDAIPTLKLPTDEAVVTDWIINFIKGSG